MINYICCICFYLFIIFKDMLKALKKGKENKKEVVYSEKIQNLKKLLENHILRKYICFNLL